MDIEDNHSSQKSIKSSRRVELMEAESQQSGKQDLFEQQLQEPGRTKLVEQVRNILNRHNRKHSSKKIDMRKILNSSSSNQRLPSSLRNDSSSLQHSDRPRNLYETQNSMDEESILTSFKKRHDQESFSVENTIRDSSSSISEPSDSRSHQNFNILQSLYKQEQGNISKKPGCNCKKSKCLKLYCECFQKKLYCTENCNCHDCGNNPENSKHKDAIIGALSRNGKCFEEEHLRAPQKEEHNGFKLSVPLQEVKKGCKCTKTHCLKSYCQCFQNGTYCSIFCKCADCLNKSFQQKKQ